MQQPSFVDQCEEFLTQYAKAHSFACMEEVFDKEDLLKAVPVVYLDNAYADYSLFYNHREAKEKTKQYFEEKSKEELFCDYLTTSSQESIIVDTAKRLGFEEQEESFKQQTICY